MGGTYPRTENDRFRRGYYSMLLQQQERLVEMGLSSARGSWVKQLPSWRLAESEANRLNAQLYARADDRDLDLGWYGVRGRSVFYYPPHVPEWVQRLEKSKVQSSRLKSAGLELPANELSMTSSNSDSISFSSVHELSIERDRYIDLSLDPWKDESMSKGEEPRLVETKFGQLDERTVDSLSIKVVYDAETGLSEYVDNRIENAALLERMSLNSSMPNYHQFSRAFDIPDRRERIESYLEFARNHANMIAASKAAGLPFDTFHLLPDARGAVEAASSFQNPSVIEAFARIKEIDAGALNGFAFIDPTPNPNDDETTADLRRQFDDAPMAFDIRTNQVLLSSSVTEDELSGGVLYHELFEKQIHHRYQPDFHKIAKRWKSTNVSKFSALKDDFCEVGADLRTWEFMDKDKRFVDLIYTKHGLPRKRNELRAELNDAITKTDDDGVPLMGPRRLMCVMATLRHVDEDAYHEVKAVFNEKKDWYGDDMHAEMDFITNKMSHYCHPKKEIVEGFDSATRDSKLVIYDHPESGSQLHLHTDRTDSTVFAGTLKKKGDKKPARLLSGYDAMLAEQWAQKLGLVRHVSFRTEKKKKT